MRIADLCNDCDGFLRNKKKRHSREGGNLPECSSYFMHVPVKTFERILMTKTTSTYWNVLKPENKDKWQPVDGLEDVVEELTLSIDNETGEYTRLTRFYPGADTAFFGAKSHTYPEEIFVVNGRLYDEAFNMWLETGHYASRPPGELHGPFRTEEGCLVLEVSFPNKVTL
jgi:hypothetical protein